MKPCATYVNMDRSHRTPSWLLYRNLLSLLEVILHRCYNAHASESHTSWDGVEKKVVQGLQSQPHPSFILVR